MFNVLTIAREYGSGGSDIGRKVAELLDWEALTSRSSNGSRPWKGGPRLGRAGRRTRHRVWER